MRAYNEEDVQLTGLLLSGLHSALPKGTNYAQVRVRHIAEAHTRPLRGWVNRSVTELLRE